MKKKLFLILFIIFFSIIRESAFGDTSPEEQALINQIEEVQKQISQAQNQAKTLSSQITYMDNQIKLTGLKIEENKVTIAIMEKEITSLSGKIENIKESLANLSGILLERIVATYKNGQGEGWNLMLSSKSFGEFFNKYKYIRVAQIHDKKLMFQMEETKSNYAEQKDLLEVKKKEVESLKKQLEGYTLTLASQKKDKENLLAVTRNDEARYQELLKIAQAQLASFRGFTQSQGGGVLPPQNSPDGWFYSQRDERWAGMLIGRSSDPSDSIFEVGCLVSSVAMVSTFYGDRKTPADIARNPANFYSNTAYMNSPWPSVAGKNPQNVSSSQMDQTLSQGKPVIVHLNLGNANGHFVVLKKKEGDDYIMHDPWQGYDKKLKDYYSVGNIDQRVIYN